MAIFKDENLGKVFEGTNNVLKLEMDFGSRHRIKSKNIFIYELGCYHHFKGLFWDSLSTRYNGVWNDLSTRYNGIFGTFHIL